MDTSIHPEWDPHAEPPSEGPLAEYDRMRKACPIARGAEQNWYLFRHADVMRVVLDHETFSNVVSQRVSAPNGMDPPEHTPIRKLIEEYFAPGTMSRFEPVCRAIADELLQAACAEGTVEVMSALGYPFAARAQCAFLGWPEEMSDRLISWTQRNQEAARVRDRAQLDALGAEFDSLIVEAIDACDAEGGSECATRTLAEAEVNGRRLTQAELTSIFRNWTVGEIGSLASSIGILLHELTEDLELQRTLRDAPEKIVAATDEILRVHGPLISNRRRTTRAVQLCGRQIAAGDMVNVVWVSANRDERVFDAPLDVQLDRDTGKNLLYGAGIHVCPGAPLARLEMKVFLEACFAHTEEILPVTHTQPVRGQYPASGYSRIDVSLR